MNFQVILFKNSDCDLCKLMQQELIDNPPNADVKIVRHIGQSTFDIVGLEVDTFPTTVILDENGFKVNVFKGFVNSKTIDENIKNYERNFRK